MFPLLSLNTMISRDCLHNMELHYIFFRMTNESMALNLTCFHIYNPPNETMVMDSAALTYMYNVGSTKGSLLL